MKNKEEKGEQDTMFKTVEEALGYIRTEVLCHWCPATTLETEIEKITQNLQGHVHIQEIGFQEYVSGDSTSYITERWIEVCIFFRYQIKCLFWWVNKVIGYSFVLSYDYSNYHSPNKDNWRVKPIKKIDGEVIFFSKK